MTILERLEREAKRHPGATGEGVRVALGVLLECRCETCRHVQEEHSEQEPDTQLYCGRTEVCGGMYRTDGTPPVPSWWFCAGWEER